RRYASSRGHYVSSSERGITVPFITHFRVRRDAGPVRNNSEGLHPCRARTQEVQCIASGQTHIHAGCHGEPLSVVYVVFSAENYVTDSGCAARIRKLGVEAWNLRGTLGSKHRVGGIEGMPHVAGGTRRCGRGGIGNYRGLRRDAHLNIQNRDGDRKIETVCDPVSRIERVLMNREVDIVRRLYVVAHEARVPCITIR